MKRHWAANPTPNLEVPTTFLQGPIEKIELIVRNNTLLVGIENLYTWTLVSLS